MLSKEFWQFLESMESNDVIKYHCCWKGQVLSEELHAVIFKSSYKNSETLVAL